MIIIIMVRNIFFYSDFIYIYIYIYIDRERERERAREKLSACMTMMYPHTLFSRSTKLKILP
jgi:hypothetical protein